MVCPADQAAELWVYPTLTRRGLLVVTVAWFSLFLLSPPPGCFSVRKALGPCRSVPGVPRARVPLLLAFRLVSLGWVLTSACDTLLAAWLPCSAVCPGFVLLCLLPPNSPRTSRPFHAYALRCLILLIVLRTFSVYPACCIHSGMDAKTSAWFVFPGLFTVLRYSLYQRVPPLDLLAIASPPTRVLLSVHMLSWCAWW